MIINLLTRMFVVAMMLFCIINPLCSYAKSFCLEKKHIDNKTIFYIECPDETVVSIKFDNNDIVVDWPQYNCTCNIAFAEFDKNINSNYFIKKSDNQHWNFLIEKKGCGNWLDCKNGPDEVYALVSPNKLLLNDITEKKGSVLFINYADICSEISDVAYELVCYRVLEQPTITIQEDEDFEEIEMRIKYKSAQFELDDDQKRDLKKFIDTAINYKNSHKQIYIYIVGFADKSIENPDQYADAINCGYSWARAKACEIYLREQLLGNQYNFCLFWYGSSQANIVDMDDPDSRRVDLIISDDKMYGRNKYFFKNPQLIESMSYCDNDDKKKCIKTNRIKKRLGNYNMKWGEGCK
jgi:hypothetical protein